eukprot:7171014-Prymnesium_polylepis.1
MSIGLISARREAPSRTGGPVERLVCGLAKRLGKHQDVNLGAYGCEDGATIPAVPIEASRASQPALVPFDKAPHPSVLHLSAQRTRARAFAPIALLWRGRAVEAARFIVERIRQLSAPKALPDDVGEPFGVLWRRVRTRQLFRRRRSACHWLERTPGTRLWVALTTARMRRTLDVALA